MDQNARRKLKIKLDDLIFAFEQNTFQMRHYLDKETGAVLMVTDETRHILDGVYEEIGPDASQGQVKEHLAGREDIPAWQIDAVLEAHQVEEGYGDTVIEVPQVETHEAYEDMADFVDMVSDRRLRERLADAIDGRGAFSRFRHTLGQHPGERERWFAFKEQRMRQRVLDWLESEGIALLDEEDGEA